MDCRLFRFSSKRSKTCTVPAWLSELEPAIKPVKDL